MTKKDILLKEISDIPEHLLDKLIDFIRIIKWKHVDQLPQLVKETGAVYRKGKVKTDPVCKLMNEVKKEQNMLEFHVLVEKEGEFYSALCLELNVASQGRTLIQANKNIREAITLYLEDVYDAKDEKNFVPRPAPVSEWLKYFKQDAENLKAIIRSRNLKPRYKEVVVG